MHHLSLPPSLRAAITVAFMTLAFILFVVWPPGAFLALAVVLTNEVIHA